MARLSRDEVVEKGLAAAHEQEVKYENGIRKVGPWLYKIKLRSGRRAGTNHEYQAWNIPHLRALILMDRVRNNETLNATIIQRVMKSQFSSRRENDM